MNKNEQKAIEHNRDTVKSWLLDHNFSVEEKRAPNELWTLDAFELGRRFGFGVAQPKRNPEVISIAVTFSFEEFQEDLDSMLATERRDFVLDLWHTLLTFDIEFRPQGEPLNGVMLICYIYRDEFKRSVFWQKVRLIRRAFWAALWAFQKKFDRPLADPPIEEIETVN